MKIILSAFVCEPGKGSEEGIGWGIAWTLARHHQVHVLTIPRCRPAIERFLAAHPQPSLSFSYFEFDPPLLQYARTSSLWQTYYHIWQLRLVTWTRALIENWNPDVIHHVTYGRYWSPSSLVKLDFPFVWGPVGGGDTTPDDFVATYSPRGRRMEHLRRVARQIGETLPSVKLTARRSAIGLATTPQTAARLRALGAPRVTVSAHAGLPQEELPTELTPPPLGPPSFCCVGHLLHWKGFHLAIEAFATANIPNAELTIVGDGQEKPYLVELAARLGVLTRVKFAGRLQRPDVIALMRASTALLHPSLHDSGGFVCLEAMAQSRPVVCLNLGGPGEMVTAETGFAVPAIRPAQAVAELAGALQSLAQRPKLVQQLGVAGYERVRDEFTWEKKAQQFDLIYHELAGSPLRTMAV